MTTSMKKTICAVLLAICIACGISLGIGYSSVAYAESNTTVPTSETVQSGLGMAINVVTAQELNDYKFGKMVFDSEKLQNLSTSRVDLSKSEQHIYSTTDIDELIKNYSSNTGLGVEVDALVLTVSVNFKSGISFNYSDYNYKYFYVISNELPRYRLSINNYLQTQTYADCYSDYFLNDLSKLANGTMSYDEFFADYGTHIVGSATYGGRLNAYYSVVSNKLLMNKETTVGVETAIGAGLSSGTVVKVTSEIERKTGITYSEEEIKTAFHLQAYGGSAISTDDIDNFSSALSSWTNSFDSLDNSVVIGYDNQGLVPLWDLLPENYQDMSAEMEQAYIEYYQNTADTVLEGFQTANYKDFAGGTGTVEDPFLLSKPEHLMNIEKVSMTANYKMIRNISLALYTDWTPIGGYYGDKEFNGVLDGDDWAIFALKRTAEIPEQEDYIYFGLFGCVGSKGVVKNLEFHNVNIKMTGPQVNDPGTRLFVGALAGSFKGTATNVEIYSGTCSFDANTNGTSLVGGIAGIATGATFKNCTNRANITSGRWSGIAGGIVAHSNGSRFEGCLNTGNITTKCTGWGGYAISGGIVGEKYKDTVTNINSYCQNTGGLSASYYAWGLSHTLKTDDICAFTTTSKYE